MSGMFTRRLSKDRTMMGPLTHAIAGATSYIVWTLSTGRRAVIRRLYWNNNTGADTYLSVGFLTLGAVFTVVFPRITTINGMSDWMEMPLVGNTLVGFAADTTLVTGSLGNIIVQVGAAGAAPNDVEVQVEVEEF